MMRQGIFHALKPCVIFILIVFQSLIQARAGGEEGLWRLLERRDKAPRHYNYIGVQMTTAQAPQDVLSLTQVVHRKPSLTLIRYKAPEFLAGMVILDDGSQNLSYIPQRQRLIVTESFFGPSQTAASAQQLQRLKANYEIVQVGRETFSNRRCLVVEIRPRYPGNPKRKLWLDAATGLELKTERYNARGKLSMTTRFVEIAFPASIPDERVALPAPAQTLEKIDRMPVPLELKQCPQMAGFQALMPQYLPRGYTFLGASLLRAGKRAIVHLKFSDGMNTISLFERLSGDRRSHDRQHGRWPGLQAQIKEWTIGDLKLTLMSDLPEEELERIAGSVF